MNTKKLLFGIILGGLLGFTSCTSDSLDNSYEGVDRTKITKGTDAVDRTKITKGTDAVDRTKITKGTDAN